MSRNLLEHRGAVPVFSAHDAETIRSEMELVLRSSHFRHAKRCQMLLQYITERTLAGDAEACRERAVGIAVFGREPDYDTSQDPVVRTTAAEIRKKLAQFYQEIDHESPAKITLLPGSYQPEFTLQLAPTKAEKKPLPIRKLRYLGLALATVAIAFSALAYFKTRPSALDEFWGHVFEVPGGVLFCLGQPSVLNIRSDARQGEVHQLIDESASRAANGPKLSIPLADLIPMPNRYVDIGDAVCLVRLTSFLEKHGTIYEVRGSRSTAFSDLREHPTVFIGAFNNEWTMQVVRPLRYTFSKTFQGQDTVDIIRDRDHPKDTQWKLINAWPDWNIPFDYALVTSLRDPDTDRMEVVAAGITHFGTQAAGEFLTNADYFAEAASKLPRNWSKKNLQIVLQVPVVRGEGGRPRVLATYVW